MQSDIHNDHIKTWLCYQCCSKTDLFLHNCDHSDIIFTNDLRQHARVIIEKQKDGTSY